MQFNRHSNKLNDCYSEAGVVYEYEDKGLVLLENKIFSKYLTKSGSKILDVGCFVGRVSFPLAQKGFEVFGIDRSIVGVQRANELKKQNNIDNVYFEVASAENIPFENEMFDYVLFPYNTIENIPTNKMRIAALQESHRVLKNDGLLLFSILNRHYPKYFTWTAKNEVAKLLWKVFLRSGLNKVFPLHRENYLQDNVNTEFGSVLWIEPGGTKYSEYHFSTAKEIKELLKKSSFRLIEKIPVMSQGPQRINADILEMRYFTSIKAPVFYYICKKS